MATICWLTSSKEHAAAIASEPNFRSRVGSLRSKTKGYLNPQIQTSNKKENTMSLKTRLTEDMKTAMRAKDTLTLSTIRLANAEIKRYEVDERAEADDVKITAMLSKMIKQRKESATIYHEAGRQDLADKELAEVAILQRYLPEMLSEAEIQSAVAEAIAQTGASGMADMGKAMGVLKKRLAGQADMSDVSRLLKTALQK